MALQGPSLSRLTFTLIQQLKNQLTLAAQLAYSLQEFFWSCGCLPNMISNTSAVEHREEK